MSINIEFGEKKRSNLASFSLNVFKFDIVLHIIMLKPCAKFGEPTLRTQGIMSKSVNLEVKKG